MRPRRLRVRERVEEGDGIFTLRFDEEFDVVAGEFGMYWVYGVDEIPMSFAYRDGITVRAVGDATEAMSALEEGDHLGMRGPFGTGFDVPDDDLLVVGGGTGMAPTAMLAEQAAGRGADVTVLVGAATADEVVFDERLADVADVRVATEDGSCGHEGLVTELIDDIVDERGEPEDVAACGPEPMMAAVLDRFSDRPDDVQVALERYMKCGIGVCGSCCVDPTGSPVCAEGPVYRGSEVEGGEFGVYHRDAAARKRFF